MALNHFVKKAAAKKYAEKAKELTSDELMELIKQDEKKFTADEVVEIAAAIYDNAPDEETPAPAVFDKNNPNNSINLAGFDYTKLTGAAFEQYNETVAKLPLNDLYDFELYAVKPVRVERYPGLQGSPVDFIGLTLRNTAPEHKTRIPVKVAKEYNSQILNQHSVAGHGKYYLLSKSK